LRVLENTLDLKEDTVRTLRIPADYQGAGTFRNPWKGSVSLVESIFETPSHNDIPKNTAEEVNSIASVRWECSRIGH